MSHATVTQCSTDPKLIERVNAAIAKEAFNNEALSTTKTAEQVKAFGPQSVNSQFMWPISIDNEAAYEYAVGSENPNPGGDPGVISDGAITSGVTAHWPEEDTEFDVGTKYTIQILGVVP